MPNEQAVERMSREVQEWMQATTKRLIADMLDDGRGLFAAKVQKPEAIAFMQNEFHRVGLIGPDGTINPQARAVLIAKYGEGGYTQALEAMNAATVAMRREQPPEEAMDASTNLQ